MAEVLTSRQGIWSRNTEFSCCSCCIVPPVEFRAGLRQVGGITACWGGHDCPPGQGAWGWGECASGLSNICSSPTEFSPMWSLNVLHYARAVLGHLRRLVGDVCQLPDFSVRCSDHLAAVITPRTPPRYQGPFQHLMKLVMWAQMYIFSS